VVIGTGALAHNLTLRGLRLMMLDRAGVASGAGRHARVGVWAVLVDLGLPPKFEQTLGSGPAPLEC